MAQNQAAKKAAKANRRKAIVAGKRKAEAAAGSRAGLVREGAAQRILHCAVSDGLWENGIGNVVLSRGASAEQQYVAVFMVDAFALGVKDLFFRVMDRAEARQTLDLLDMSDPGSPVDPGEARKLLRDAVQWAEANGFPPPREFAAVERLFGSVAVSETDYTARFGRDGVPTYIPGPNETPREISRRLAVIHDRLGPEAAAMSMLSLVQNLIADRDEDPEPDFDDQGPVLEHGDLPAENELAA